MEKIEGEEDKVVVVVSIKHCLNIKPDKAKRGIGMVKEGSLRDSIGRRDSKKEDHGEAQYSWL